MTEKCQNLACISHTTGTCDNGDIFCPHRIADERETTQGMGYFDKNSGQMVAWVANNYRLHQYRDREFKMTTSIGDLITSQIDSRYQEIVTGLNSDHPELADGFIEQTIEHITNEIMKKLNLERKDDE